MPNLKCSGIKKKTLVGLQRVNRKVKKREKRTNKKKIVEDAELSVVRKKKAHGGVGDKAQRTLHSR